MIETYHSVRCDECGRQADVVKGEQVALTHAEYMGYALNVDDSGRDLCSRCNVPSAATDSGGAA